MKWVLAGVVLVAFVVGCSDPNATINRGFSSEKQNGRMKVLSAQVFYDASGRARDIMVLQDSTTGYEYLFVLGGGVLQMVDEDGRQSEE